MTTMNATTTKRTEIKDGDIVRNYGSEFIASNVTAPAGRITRNGEQVFLYTGHCTANPCNDGIRGSGYDGGTYSWRASDEK